MITSPCAPHSLGTPAVQARVATVYIDVQHGLCNRLRAIASASSIAQATGRRLVVLWHPDSHCEARMLDLLSYVGPIIEEDAGAELRETCTHVFNYMEVEAGARFDEPIEVGEEGDVFIRSAYSLISSHVTHAAEQRFFRSLRPSDPVADLVRRVERNSDVAVHIRMQSGPSFEHLPWESLANWPAERHAEIHEWRRKSDVARFIARLDTLIADGKAESIFVSADLAATYAVLRERYGPRLRLLERGSFDRSAEQAQYAVADLMLLARGRRLLASTWSSFSDVAQRLAANGRPVEQSGIDF